MNSGPQHPATHGVLRSIAILHGEIIQWISPEIGLLHRGTEKLIECNYYNSNIGYFFLIIINELWIPCRLINININHANFFLNSPRYHIKY